MSMNEFDKLCEDAVNGRKPCANKIIFDERQRALQKSMLLAGLATFSISPLYSTSLYVQ